MKRHLALLMGALAATAGCQKTESKTEIVLEISTNIPVPAGMNTLSLKIGSQANPQALNKTYALGTGAGQIMLPRRMGLVPTDTSTVLSVLVEGLLDGKTVISRQVLTSFAKGDSKLLSIELLQKCVGQVCPNGQTCTPTAFCTDPHIAPTSLPPFDPAQTPKTPGLDPDGGTSLDARLDQSSDDGKKDVLPGKDGVSFDGQPNPDRWTGDGQTELDVPTMAPDALVEGDGPGGIVVPGPDAPTLLDGTQPLDTAVAKTDTGVAIDAPLVSPDLPPASRTKGVACTLSGECESGLTCVDGVCCESKCDGLCMACNVPGKQGTCAAVPLNDPSNGDCPDDGVATCARNGRCNGAGGCMLYPMGVSCSAETCPAGTSNHTRPGLCDGKGVCGLGQVQDCAPFLCDATTNSCSPTCTGDTDCVAPNKCNNGSCGKKGNGQPCSAASECQSNICAQGMCCSGPCTDLCKSCAVNGSLGTCTAVPAGMPDVQNRCKDLGAITCGTNGLCDGASACQKYPDNVTCGAFCDTDNATFQLSTCFSEACLVRPSQSCLPYSCDNRGCKKSCTVVTDCAPGFVCGAGGLCVRPIEDCMNNKDDDGDGLVDCADPDCTAGFTCAPAVPTGFTGPVEIAEGATQADLPACGGAYPDNVYNGYGGLQCPAGTCSACSCGSLTGAACNNPGLAIGSSSDLDKLFCSARTTAIPPAEIGVCQGPLAISQDKYHFTTGSVANKGTCTSSGGTLNTPPPAFSWNAIRTCGSPAKGGGGCGASAVCWPKPQSAYQPQACVVAAGNLACPSSGYSNKRDTYDSQDIDDGRSCSGCSCSPTDVSCESDLYLYPAAVIGKEAGCSSIIRVVPVTVSTDGPTSACATTTADISYLRVTAPSLKGSCAPTGTPVPTGTCTPKGNQTTVCCTP
jgi:hypothetical protein